jgi:hypothetical protein
MPFDLRTSFDMNLHHMVQAIVTVLAVINPVVCGSIFLTLTPKLAVAQRRWAAVKVAWAQSLEHIQHFIRRVPDRRRDDHCVYGIRYAQRPSYGRSSAAPG